MVKVVSLLLFVYQNNRRTHKEPHYGEHRFLRSPLIAFSFYHSSLRPYVPRDLNKTQHAQGRL